jgi:hypothetical protein
MCGIEALSRARGGGANHGPRTFECTTRVWARPAYTNAAPVWTVRVKLTFCHFPKSTFFVL